MKKRILFDLKKEYYFNSLYPLYEVLAEDSDYDIHFYVGPNDRRIFGFIPVYDRKNIQQSLRDKGLQVTEETSGFDAVVCGDALRNPQRYGDVHRFHVDHGMGIKTLRIRNVHRQKDVHYHVFLEGQYWMDYIKSLAWGDCADFYLTGIPKLDPFFRNGSYDNEKLTRELGLDPRRKTILFAPSYKPSCIPFLKQKILELTDTYNVIVKLHPYSYGGKYAPLSQSRLYVKESRKRDSLFLIPKEQYDIYPYLYLADTLISDTSSVVNEFLALGKHGIIYVLPHEKLNHSDGMPILSIDPAEWLKGAFPQMHSPDDLQSAVELALNPRPEMQVCLEEYRNYFFTGLDGQASLRVKFEIDKLLKEAPIGR
ncbi:CDP-glycerol glycerophosphotransferase family protein [bacterium]|nr:CDP-glycerol glycerophosphotransferase family protein [bacterium]